ncbi:unnamed protein product [Closterium sp. NIES-65]|nr:unnamed protein product [Closterium sp. NIES-65]
MDEAALSDVARRARESTRESSSRRLPDASAHRSSFSFNPPPLVAGEEGDPGSKNCEADSAAGEIGQDDSVTAQKQEKQEEAERCRCEKWMAFQQSIAAAEEADVSDDAAESDTTSTSFKAPHNSAADVSGADAAKLATVSGNAATGTIGDSSDSGAADSFGDCSAATCFGRLQAPGPSAVAAGEAEAPSVALSVAPSGAAASETLFSRRMKSQSHPAPRVVPVLGDTTTGTRNFPFPLARGLESAGAMRSSPLRNFPVPRSSSHTDRFPPPRAAVTAAFPPEPWFTCGSSTYQYTQPRVTSGPLQSCTSESPRVSEPFRSAAIESPRVTVMSMVTEIAYEPLPEGLFTPLSPLSASSAASAAPALFSPDGLSARFFDSPGASSSASVSSASVLSPGASPSSSPAAHTFSSRHRRQSSASHATTPPLITSLQGDVPRSPPAPFRRRSHSFASLNTFQLQRKIHASPSPPMSPSLAPCFVRAEGTETGGQGATKVRPESGGASGAATAASTLAEARAARLSTSAAAATAANPGRTKIFASVPLNKPPYLSSPASTGYANSRDGEWSEPVGISWEAQGRRIGGERHRGGVAHR